MGRVVAVTLGEGGLEGLRRHPRRSPDRFAGRGSRTAFDRFGSLVSLPIDEAWSIGHA
jgi:hypothetical protein